MGNKIANKEMSICVNCIHAYVCEEYNLNRDMLRKRCAYHNDHFLDIEQHDTKLRKETAERDFCTIIKALEERKERVKVFYSITESVGVDIAIRTVKELAKQFGVEVE